MKMACALGLLLSMALGACSVFKPENRVRLGMTPEQVEALVGPPRLQAWQYRRPDETIEVQFRDCGAWMFNRWYRSASGEETIQYWREDGPLYGETFKPFQRPGAHELKTAVPPSQMPVLGCDPPAKVLKLYGPPSYMFMMYRVDPWRGSFTDGKLDWWETGPLPPPVP